MLELGIKVLASYLLGSLNGALLLGRIRGVDVRGVGSGNPGGTNALRAGGARFAAQVMVIDIGKGFLPPWLLPGLVLPGLALDPALSREWLALACAAAAILGHCYPVWYGFAGGKGAATAVGALAALAPGLLIPAAVVWVLVLTTTGFVGLATILAAAVLPLWVAATSLTERPQLFVFLLALALFIAFTHRSNIDRMREGRESRLDRARVLFRGRQDG